MDGVEVIEKDLFEHVVELVKKYSKADSEQVVTIESRIETLGIDSIDIMEIAFELEEEHGVVVDESAAMSAETLADILAALKD